MLSACYNFCYDYIYVRTFFIIVATLYRRVYIVVMCDIHDMNIYRDINDGDMI